VAASCQLADFETIGPDKDEPDKLAACPHMRQAMDSISFDLATNDPLPAKPEGDRPQPWELVEDGRYRPRRTRGSCVGRELG
jgi:hypothetical protein